MNPLPACDARIQNTAACRLLPAAARPDCAGIIGFQVLPRLQNGIVSRVLHNNGPADRSNVGELFGSTLVVTVVWWLVLLSTSSQGQKLCA